MPGHEKTCSVMIAPATSSGSSSPMTVMIGMQGVAQAVADEDDPAAQALRPGRRHVFAVEHLEHAGPGVAHQRRGVGEARGSSTGMIMWREQVRDGERLAQRLHAADGQEAPS